jgi:glycosyltransferase involved in cell wall biosynthesis
VDPSGTHRVIPVLLWLIERLARRHDLTVVATAQFDDDRTYPLRGATVRCLGSGGRLSRNVRLARLLATLDPDVIHLHWLSHGLAAWAASRAARCPLVVTIHGGELVRLPDIGYGGGATAAARGRMRFVLRAAAAVTCASGDTEARVVALGARAVRLPLGVDTVAFPRRSAEPPAPPWRLLHVGSLSPVKDQRTLLDALARLRERGVDAELEIVGEPARDDVATHRAADPDVADRVRSAGYVPWTELASHYHRAHLLIVSSRHETGPIVALEAAACGVPVAGTAVGHVKDWAAGGLLRAAPPADAGALADVAAELMNDAGKRHQVAARLHAFAREHDADATGRALEALYQRVTERGT